MEIKQTNTHDTAPDTYPLEKNPQNTATESSEGAKQKGFPLWIKIGLALLLLILLGTAFYFFYWIRTPIYSINIIRTSVKQHDVATFEKHVDLDQLVSQTFDSFLEAQIELDPKINPQLVKGLAIFGKPIATNALKGYILNQIGTSKPEMKTTESSGKKNKGQTVDDFSKKSGIDSLDFKGFGSTKTDGDMALVEIKFFEKELKKDFTLVLKMVKLEDGTWKLIEVENLKQHLVDYSKAQKAQ
jgi:hypothetical protein